METPWRVTEVGGKSGNGEIGEKRCHARESWHKLEFSLKIGGLRGCENPSKLLFFLFPFRLGP